MGFDLGGWDAKHRELVDAITGLEKGIREVKFPVSDQQRSPQLREWERFALIDGGQATAGGALTVGGGGSNLRPAPTGWEAYVHSVAVTVSGASHAGTIAYYNGEASDQNLFDWAAAIGTADSPSRIVTFYAANSVYVEQGDGISLVFAAVAASASVTVRVTGRRRMLGGLSST